MLHTGQFGHVGRSAFSNHFVAQNLRPRQIPCSLARLCANSFAVFDVFWELREMPEEETFLFETIFVDSSLIETGKM